MFYTGLIADLMEGKGSQSSSSSQEEVVGDRICVLGADTSPVQLIWFLRWLPALGLR